MSLSNARYEHRVIESQYIAEKWRNLLLFCGAYTISMFLLLGSIYLNPPKVNKGVAQGLIPNLAIASPPILIFFLWKTSNSFINRDVRRSRRKRYRDLKARIYQLGQE